MRIVNLRKEQMDEDNFVYAVCECTLAWEGIEVPRKYNSGLININCPRCGRRLGIMARGRKDIQIDVPDELKIKTSDNVRWLEWPEYYALGQMK